MSTAIEVKVPDIGDATDVEIIEVLVKEGDTIQVDQSLITVESDKASMEIPSNEAGVVKSIKVALGDKVKEGTIILLLEPAAKSAAAAKDEPAHEASAQGSSAGKPAGGTDKVDRSAPAAPAAGKPADKTEASSEVTVSVPDIGDATDVEVIEIMVKEGDTVAVDQSLITVESDKASMEVPSSHAGTVKSVKVKLGDRVNKGSEILILLAQSSAAEAPADAAEPSSAASANDNGDSSAASQSNAARPADTAGEHDDAPDDQDSSAQAASGELASVPPERQSPTSAYALADVPSRNLPHASPSVRKFARELGVNLAGVQGSGTKNRITHDDVRRHVKQVMASSGSVATLAPAQAGGLSVLGWPKVDFAKFGPIDTQPLSRIKKISGANLHRNWVMIPHVTNNEQADITDLEAFRQTLNGEQGKSGTKVTMLAFLIKAVVAALKKHPEFNASLDGETLVLKKYYHIGFAADTPNGLVVPVIRDADKKGVLDIAAETSELASAARSGKLSPAQMQGGCFSISSLGGIGGTHFTPIINAPEVAILGVSRSSQAPVWDGSQFVPRLMLPLSLSYDHRVIDGAAAARFNAYLASLLADFRRIIL